MALPRGGPKGEHATGGTWGGGPGGDAQSGALDAAHADRYIGRHRLRDAQPRPGEGPADRVPSRAWPPAWLASGPADCAARRSPGWKTADGPRQRPSSARTGVRRARRTQPSTSMTGAGGSVPSPPDASRPTCWTAWAGRCFRRTRDDRLRSGRPALRVGLMCGGSTEVFTEGLDGPAERLRRPVAAMDSGEGVAVATVVDGPGSASSRC